jgi:polysaccharide biosynthesis protein PslH
VSKINKKHILYLTQDYPVGEWSGGIIKTLRSINKLASVYQLDVVCFSMYRVDSIRKDPNIKYYVVGRHIQTAISQRSNFILIRLIKRIFNIRFSIKTAFCNFIDSLIHINPFSCKNYFDTRYSTIVEKLIRNNHYSAIHIDHITLANYLPKTKLSNQVYILEEDDIKTKTAFDICFYSNSLYNKIFYFYETVISYLYEFKKYHMFDHIFAISEYDRVMISNLFFVDKTRITTFRPSLKYQKINAMNKMSRTTPILLFLGNLNWKPNLDGFVWFVKSVFPNIIKKIPNIKLYIVGKYKYEDVYNLPNQKLMLFLGYKEKIAAFLKKCSIFIVPIRINSGFRTKFLTAMGNGIPIVTTTKGSIGLEPSKNNIFLKSDTAQGFSNQVLKLLSNKKLQIRLTSNAYNYIHRYYSDKNLADFLCKYMSITNNS